MHRTGHIGLSPYSIGRFTYGFEGIRFLWNEGSAFNIGSFCSIAQNCTVVLGGNHRTDWATTYPFGHIHQNELGGHGIVGHPSTKGDINIGNDVWIGMNATIFSGVNIGDGAVITANACVTKDVLPYHIAGGNPARMLKKRFDDNIIGLLMELSWWDLPLDVIREIAPVLCSEPTEKKLSELIEKYVVC